MGRYTLRYRDCRDIKNKGLEKDSLALFTNLLLLNGIMTQYLGTYKKEVIWIKKQKF